ncbi:MAG: xanthine dehydrogenase family protein molybdopterin-binding subunit [Candidatus Rokuibacteriota bacterium]
MTWIGASRRRVEDRPLLIGAGRFTDDLGLPGTLHAQFLRSPHAHARLARLDVAAARSAPGVVAVATGEDVRGLPAPSVNRFALDIKVAPQPCLADGVVRAVGEPVAAVVAATAAHARDALDLIQVEYEMLPAVPTPADALAAGAPVLHPEIPGNAGFTVSWRAGDVADAFRRAHLVARLRVGQTRLAAVALEPRAILAAWDTARDEMTIWISTQTPFRVRSEMARMVGIPESSVRVIAPDVGGGFGVKGSVYREEIAVTWLARRLGRPVKWVSTRAEDLATTQHGRGADAEGELAVDAEGRILGLRARILHPLGSVMTFTAAGPARNYGRTLPGAYRVPALDIEARGVYTTTGPTGPYRGAGRPEGTFLIERLVDEAARALGLDPAEIRRRNLIAADAFPYRTGTGCVYDSGDYPTALALALERSGWGRLREAQRRARERGEVVGAGLCTYVEPSALGWESGSVRVERTGAVTVVTGSSAHGQGHETVFAQIVADALGVDPETIRVLHGDTQGVPQGIGTFGSRSTALGGGALHRAAGQVREKAERIAAHLLEVAPADLVAGNGGFNVAGVADRRITWAQIGDAAYRPMPRVAPGDTPGLEASVFFAAEDEAWSFGACVVEVSVDRDTGEVRLTRVLWVDDAGTIINPLLAEAQLHGSYAQGAGQALLEGVVYDRDGQLLSATLMDYALPRLGDFPEPECVKMHTPSPRNPLGAKGLGEAGCIALPPAIVNAVVDALAPFGCTHLDMPLTAEKVWRTLSRSS